MPKDESKVSKRRASKEDVAPSGESSEDEPALSESASGESESQTTFEAALRELETVVGTLENGGVPLETSLQMLKRGLELADRCERVLADAELTLEKLVLTDEGELISEELEAE